MRQLNEMKVCARGERCLHPEKQSDGRLPAVEFTSAGEEDEMRNRAICRVCISWLTGTADGALELVAKDHGDDARIALKYLNSAKSPFVDRKEAAVLLGISYNKLTGLSRAGKLTPAKKGTNNREFFDKETVLRFKEEDYIKKLQQGSTQSAWEKTRRVLNEDKARIDERAHGSPESAAAQIEHAMAYTQQVLPSDCTETNEPDEIIKSLVVCLKSFFMPSALATGADIDDYIDFATPAILANAIKRAEKYLRDKSGDSEVVTV